MRRFLVVGLALCLAVSAQAVEKRPVGKRAPRPAVSKTEPSLRFGWYVAPVLKFGEVRNETRTLVGIRGGLELNRSFYVGVAGYGLPHRNRDTYPIANRFYHDHYDHDWTLGYGGVELGLIGGTPRHGQVSVGVLPRRWLDQ